MRIFLIHKNISPYHWLRRRTEKERALSTPNTAKEIFLDMEIFFMIRFLAVAGLVIFWTFLVFLNVASFLKHFRGWIR